MKIKLNNQPLKLVGREITEGMPAPFFKAVDNDLQERNLFDFKDKLKVITSFPSLDTPVCDLQLKEFDKRAVSFSQDIVVIGISKDLPFAQKRFCQINNIKNVITLSDYKYSFFGLNYGLLIEELNLLARAILIIDKKDVIRYLQIVEEITRQPDYIQAERALLSIINEPSFSSQKKYFSCKPCEGFASSLTKEKIEQLEKDFSLLSKGWRIREERKIVKEFAFKEAKDGKIFFDIIWILAEENNHHPVVSLSFNKVKVSLSTHKINGLSENDFIMASLIENVYENSDFSGG